MAKLYVTFGQEHSHVIVGKVFDKDCVAVIDCTTLEDARNKAFEYFNRGYSFKYYDRQFDMADLQYYPRGLIEVT